MKFKRRAGRPGCSFEPRYSFRRFTDSTLGNGDDRERERCAQLVARNVAASTLTASYWDQSTLITELLETGILTGDTHRRDSQAGATGIWNQTERRACVAQLSYAEVSYYGPFAEILLPGYRYPSGLPGRAVPVQ